MSEPNTYAVELKGVCKRYATREVVRDVDLSIGTGECLALIGHNGAGKTTLMKLMLGLTRPSAGTLLVGGQSPNGRSSAEFRKSVGYLPENVAFHDTMTAWETLAFYARLKGEPVSVCGELLERVGLTEAAKRRVRTYSKGMRQRLGLAQALLGGPRLLFLDEPTTGLDPALRRQFYDIIEQLQKAGATVLISSHALTEIETRTNRVAIMKQGALIVCGTLEELRLEASLPVRIRVSVTPGKAAMVANDIEKDVNVRKVNDRTVDLACLGVEKMDVVRRIAGLSAVVRDVDIMPPGLDEIYAHFTGEAAPQ